MSKRINFIDIAKAFAIIFIAFGHTIVHSAHCGNIFKFLYSFHVVLFFILSGYTFKIKKDESIKEFIWKKFKRIMVPYFIWAILFLIPYMIFGSNIGNTLDTSSSFDFKQQIINIIYGNGNASALKQNTSLWFLPALFSIEILYYIIIYNINKLKINKIIIIIPLLIVSYLSNNYLNIYLPWGINTSLVIGVLFYIGYLCKEYNLFSKEKIFRIRFIIILFIIGFLAFYFNDTVSCVDYKYGNLTLALLSGFCLSVCIIYLSFKISKNRILEYIGRNTMGILIFHKIIILLFQTKMGIISSILRNSNIIAEMSLSTIIVFVSIICSIIGTETIKKVLPFAIGEK